MGDGGYSRIRGELAKSLIDLHGENAYTVALQKVADGDELVASVWRKVIQDLDEHFKGEEQ
jgi:hypothetical protein